MCLFQMYIMQLHVLYNTIVGTLMILLSILAGGMYRHYHNNQQQTGAPAICFVNDSRLRQCDLRSAHVWRLFATFRE